ncbi:c-type cytochrome biogenesis protein CcsB [Nocardioides sp. ChNu-153]|uniref:c-type cytochrome biogenesis protein CcsB n=1 Tax=unclassified Nocardioides TaxID=2615069 RepID=UPI0024069B68|nr:MULTISPECIES: c-type cytochrome biogenesis protein CcsB [unclassified Nocardioides]MDF9716739.1 c-type cytochrome biogenesis protein CcsB [Nocardioides sp. ChNu-99]MDN7121951.1 c-type cytochrome biogenesis protein CcsB [Nocardioides sp. ChNu-153]
MSNEAWETLSNQAVAISGIVYFLGFIAHLWQWASLRKVPVSRVERVAVGAGARSGGVSAGRPAGRRSGATEEAWSEDEVAATAGEGARRRVAMGERLGIILTMIATAVHFVALVGRGMAADPNRVPWGNMYEFTLAGTFFVSLTYLVLLRRFHLAWLGPIVAGFVVTLLMIDVIWLHEEVAPLTEALNSYWLVIHVVSAVIATAAFTLGGFTSVLYLLKERAERKELAGAGVGAGTAGDTAAVGAAGETAAPAVRGYLARVPDLVGLDRLTYRLHAFAFPVWTFAVLITGPIWAHEAWSRYWNWDPKEVWAFITWVVYAAYLHARATAGFKGRNAAILALIGLATLWFNFIGINFFSSSSMHSYA